MSAEYMHSMMVLQWRKEELEKLKANIKKAKKRGKKTDDMDVDEIDNVIETHLCNVSILRDFATTNQLHEFLAFLFQRIQIPFSGGYGKFIRLVRAFGGGF